MKFSCLLLLSLPANIFALTSHHIPDVLAEIKQKKKKMHLTKSSEQNDVQTLFIEQQLDHFTDFAEKFQQRYFYTKRYIRADGGHKTAAFLCCGGEGPSLSTSVLIDSVHCTGDMLVLAKKLFDQNWNIHLFALEHRYYGDSWPKAVRLGQDQDNDYSDNEEVVDGVDYTDFTYLSSRQAVRDIIQFVQSPEVAEHLVSVSSVNQDIQWITFGGSYPGMLSAWSRLLHPDVIHGAVSSSAPVQPELDFSQFNEHAAWDLTNEAVGGSEECHKIFVEGHQQIIDVLEGKSLPDEEATADDPIEYIANTFNVCDGAHSLKKSQRNIDLLIGDGIIRIPSQENDPSCDHELCNIQKLCSAITSERQSNPSKSSLQILAKINNIKNGDRCIDTDWNGYVSYFSSPNQWNLNDRSWYFQTCSEFGFYQTCPLDTECPYAKGYHNIDRDLELCEKMFGIGPEDVANSILSTLEYYGGWNLTPSANAMDSSIPASGPHLLRDQDDQRIMFVNGDIDPWSELAVSGQQSINVPGASHHFWTHKVQDSDENAIAIARHQIYEMVSSWLESISPSITAIE